MDYKQAGVDIHLADIFVQKIKGLVASTYDQRTISAVGGFAALYNMDGDRYLAASTDGVGTKLKLAIDLNIHHTIGIDLVAMCVNDLLCTGARPLFFLDYLSSSELDLATHEEIIKGIVEGCRQSQMALIGGETAQMPSMYNGKDYDMAGFCVGEVYKNEILDGSRIKKGDALIGIASSGFHSNGFSLIRKLIHSSETELMKSCLTPTIIYHQLFQKISNHDKFLMKGLAHITGSGILNIPRMNENFDYTLTKLPKDAEIPFFMNEIMNRSSLSRDQLCKTFNMGIGLVVATEQPDKLINLVGNLGARAWNIGHVQGEGVGEIEIADF